MAEDEDDPGQQAWTTTENFLADDGDWSDEVDQLIERAQNAGIPPGAMIAFLMCRLSDLADERGLYGPDLLVRSAFNRATVKDEANAAAKMREALDQIVKKR